MRCRVKGCWPTRLAEARKELRDRMADYVEIELPEATEDDVAQVRALIEKVVEKG